MCQLSQYYAFGTIIFAFVKINVTRSLCNGRGMLHGIDSENIFIIVEIIYDLCFYESHIKGVALSTPENENAFLQRRHLVLQLKH